MTSDSILPNSDSLALSLAFYTVLMQHVPDLPLRDSSAHSDLGGNLFFPGELNNETRPMIIAANVAGCATLVAASGPATQKNAIRDGLVDFVVNSLDEALRILKNEIRKRGTVAVCVGLAPAQVEREMIERGVAPDLVAAAPEAQHSARIFGAKSLAVHPPELDPQEVLLSWAVAATPARWMPTLDAIAIDCLKPHPKMQRWIRLSPRFAGRELAAMRIISCQSSLAVQIVHSFKELVRSGAIGSQIAVRFDRGKQSESVTLSPPIGS